MHQFIKFLILTLCLCGITVFSAPTTDNTLESFEAASERRGLSSIPATLLTRTTPTSFDLVSRDSLTTPRSPATTKKPAKPFKLSFSKDKKTKDAAKKTDKPKKPKSKLKLSKAVIIVIVVIVVLVVVAAICVGVLLVVRNRRAKKRAQLGESVYSEVQPQQQMTQPTYAEVAGQQQMVQPGFSGQ